MRAHRSAARERRQSDTKETVVGTTLLFPCFIDGCGLFAGDVHFAMGGGEVAGTAIEMGAKVTLQAKVIPGVASLLSTMHFEGGSHAFSPAKICPMIDDLATASPVFGERVLPLVARRRHSAANGR